MNKVLRWLASSVGYLLYTVLILVLLLWVLLPAESIRLWLQAQLNATTPALHWEIKAMRATLPVGLVITGVDLREAKESGEGDSLLQVAELRVTPDFRGVLASPRELPFRYALKTLDGALRGKGSLVADKNMFRFDGEAENIQLGKMTAVWDKLGRTAAGKMSGHYRFEGNWRDPYQGTLTAELRVAEGSISLQQPVFGLDQFDFSQLTGSLELKDRVLAVTQGKADSRLLVGEYSGTVSLADPFLMSELKIDGTLEPRSELLGGLRDEATVTLIKEQLRDNKLSFALSGTPLSLGIQFRGEAGVIDGIIQGGER